MMELNTFIAKLKLAHDVPNYYNNHFPYNCGYYDGSRFSFDCWNLVKAILGGWTDNRTKGYYVSPKDFPTGDVDGYHLLMQCTNRSKDFSQLKQPGTYLYLSTSPHAGVYIGDFQYQGETFNVVECTGAWESKVQYTYVDSKGGRYLYKNGPKNKYSWTDYGLLPYVNYNATPEPIPTETPYGIDVSRWQKGFDIKNAMAEGFTYVIAKAGGADSGYYKDGAFDNFCQQAKAYGAKLGAYYFGNAFSTQDAVTEANYFLQYLQGKGIKHVYYDVEGKMLNQGYNLLTSIIETFCQTMISNGYICGIYTSESQFNSRFDDKRLSAYPHWVAKYSKNPPNLKSGNPIEIWQFGGSTNYIRSPKIAGTTVDQNFFYKAWSDDSIQPLPVPTGYVIDGVDYSEVFNPTYYRDHNPDVAASPYGVNDNTLWEHFRDFGMNELRRGNDTFDARAYKERYEDLRNAYGDSNQMYYWHWIVFGKAEGRNGL